MEEQLISYKTAKLAKEKGFDKENLIYQINDLQIFGIFPTQSLLQKWIRETYNIHIEIACNGEEYMLNYLSYYEKESEYLYDDSYDTIGFKTYEDALEFGLQTTLKLCNEIKE